MVGSVHMAKCPLPLSCLWLARNHGNFNLSLSFLTDKNKISAKKIMYAISNTNLFIIF
jgi:hypothetical protein